MKKIEKQVIAYCSSCHALVHILELAYGTLLLSIGEEFGISFLTLGVLATVSGFAFGLSALPFGFLADRMSEKRLLIICCLGMGISSIIVGLSPNIYVLGTALLLLGLSLGIFHPTGSAYISRVVTRRGLGFGFQGVGGNIGVALGPILSATIASFMGWQAAYLIYAAPSLALAAVLFFSRPAEIPQTAQNQATAKTGEQSLRPFILPLALLLVATIMNGFTYRSIVTFLPTYLGERIHLNLFNMDSVMLAGSFTTIALFFGIGGQFLGGYLSEKMRHEVLAIIVPLASIPLLLIMGNSTELTLIIAASSFAFFHFMGQPIFNNLIADYSPTRWRGTIFGIYFFFSFGLGSFSAGPLGYVADHFGINWVFIISAGFGVLTLVCVLALLIRALEASKQARTSIEQV